MMAILRDIYRGLSKFRAGYPGGWKKYARGTDGMRWGKTPPFVQPTSSDDVRSLIPPLGLREYWYPALPAKGVGRKKPVAVRLLGTDLVLFRDKEGEVRALWDYCPHRGVYLSWGRCYWKGYLSCPYHGATFDGNGECVEFITEGPDSRMVGRLRARAYPTQTLKGIVFVWMGEGKPVPIEEDVPPEFFEDKTLLLGAWRYWHVNWMIAVENTHDAHNCFYVHRNSFRVGKRTDGGRARTPMGYRAKIINNKIAQVIWGGPENYYARDGKVPFQMYYPRVGGYWPRTRWRLLWGRFFDWHIKRKRRLHPRFQTPEEWEGQRLPGMVRNNHWDHMYTRWCIPVDENLTRVLYVRTARPSGFMAKLLELLFWPLHNWEIHFNFSDQDYDAMRSVRYQYPEFLSSTDAFMVRFRRLIVQHGRGLNSTEKVSEETTAEKLVEQADQELGVEPAADNGTAGGDQGKVAPPPTGRT